MSTAGSVDDGKSTLIGRLLWETGGVYRDQVAEARRSTTSPVVREAGVELDPSLFTDGLEAEREQGITIDVAHRHLTTPRRRFIIADTPGHEQYTRNMVTGASTADVAMILVDAQAGPTTQTRRHAYIAWLLGLRHVVLCVNKMDRVGWAAARFLAVRDDFEAHCARLGLASVVAIPTSALLGDNVVRRSARTPWYDGPALLEHLETVPVPQAGPGELRFPVQGVLRDPGGARLCAGQLTAGAVRPGDEVLVLPSRRLTRVARIVTWEGSLDEAVAPQSVALALADDLDVTRGDLLAGPAGPPAVTQRLEAMLVALADEPLRQGGEYLLKHATGTVQARLEQVRWEVDVVGLGRRLDRAVLPMNAIGCAVLSTRRPLLVDRYREHRATGALILIDPATNATAGAGMVLEPVAGPSGAGAPPGRVVADEPPPVTRARLLGQRGALVWLAGPGAEQAAARLERALLARGRMACVAGDAAAARLLADAGLFAIVAQGAPPPGALTFTVDDPEAAAARVERELEARGCFAPGP